jgi:replicative superfamily II helicase
MTQQHPIESTFAENLVDNLNAEISLGTVTNMQEAVRWLSYTYLFVRMKRNPFHYGMDWQILQNDPSLASRRAELLDIAARKLCKARMISYDERNGFLTPKDLGRIASNFYIRHSSIETFNELMRPRMSEADVLATLSKSTEFENIKLRDDEVVEMKRLSAEQCVCEVKVC